MGTASFGQMQNPVAQRVCSAAGIATIKGKMTSLLDLRRSLIIAIADAEKAESDAKFWDAALLAAQLTKGTCDGIIGVLGEIAGPWGKVIKEGYKTTSGVAGDVSRYATGDKTVNLKATAANAVLGTISTASAGAKARYSAIGGDFRNSKELGDKLVNRTRSPIVAAAEKRIAQGGITSGRIDAAKKTADGLKTLDRSAKAVKIPSDVIIDAVDSEQKGKKLDAGKTLNRMAWDLGSMAADTATELSDAKINIGSAGAVKLSAAYSAAKDLVSATASIYEAVDKYRNDSSATGIVGARKTLLSQLKSIDKRIANLNDMLLECEPPSVSLP